MNFKNYLFTFILALSSMTVWGQLSRVSGTVRDNAGDPIIGVTVMLQGTTIGTTTDANGHYSINVPAGKNSVLDFNYIGFESKGENVGTRTQIDVVLAVSSIQLDEVVTIGYGVQRKSHLTGAITKIDGESIAKIPTSNLATVLQGRIAGMNVMNINSEVGSTPEISIRGAGAMNSSTPLVIVDGYPLAEGLEMINPNDIASIEVLKDASSAAIYGSRAANGVIQITTKSGEAEKPRYTAQLYYGFKNTYASRDLISQGDYIRQLMYENQWRMEDGMTTNFTGNATGATNYATMHLEGILGIYDWEELAKRDKAYTYQANFGVSGGTRKINYYISGTYLHEDGVIKHNETDRMTILMKNNIELSKSVKLGMQITNFYNKTEAPAISYSSLSFYPSWLPPRHTDITARLTGKPVGSYTHPDDFKNLSLPIGQLNPVTGEREMINNILAFNSTQANPVRQVENSLNPSEYFQSVGRATLTIKLPANLTLVTANGYRLRYSPSETFVKANVRPGLPAYGTFRSSLNINWLTENTLTWQKKYGKHNMNVMGGFTAEKTRLDNVRMQGDNYPTDRITTLNQGMIFQTGDNYTLKEEEAMASFLGRINYNFAEKYLLSLVLRADGSSKFGKNNRWGYFPSVSTGWRISQEPFAKNVPWISNLKVRASYGVTGNDRIARYANTDLLYPAPYMFGEGISPGFASTSSTRGNPNITWEQVNMSNLGLDLGVLKNRISVTADFYYSKTKSLLFEKKIPSFTGSETEWTNMGKYRTKGVDLTIDAFPIRNRQFTWNVILNLAAHRTKVLDLGGPAEIITTGYVNTSFINRVGGPVTQMYGYKVEGLFLNEADIERYPKEVGQNPGLGTQRVQDLDKNGYIDQYDRQVIGDPNPDFTYGVSNTLTYKGLTLSILIQGVQGGDLINAEHYINFNKRLNKKYNVLSRYVSPNHIGDGKTPSEQSGGMDRMKTDYVIEDGSYACLRNLTLGYAIPKKWTGTTVRMNFSANNLFYIWSKSYRGINPESRMRSTMASVNYSSPLSPAIQYGAQPIMRTFTFGLEFNF